MSESFGNSRLSVGLHASIGDERMRPAFDIVARARRLLWKDSPEARAAVPVLLPKELRVLMVGDSTNDELLIVNSLNWGGFEVRHKRVETRAGFRAALADQAWDLIVCDYCSRATNGPAVLAVYHEKGLNVPFIMISDMGEELASAVLNAGAHGFVTKQNLGPLVPTVKRELRAARERQVRTNGAT